MVQQLLDPRTPRLDLQLLLLKGGHQDEAVRLLYDQGCFITSAQGSICPFAPSQYLGLSRRPVPYINGGLSLYTE
jgi:hypothetical protein